MEDWQQIGQSFRWLIEAGFYPGLGYEKSGWEAWAFKRLGKHIGASAKTPSKAMSKLIRKIKEVQDGPKRTDQV